MLSKLLEWENQGQMLNHTDFDPDQYIYLLRQVYPQGIIVPMQTNGTLGVFFRLMLQEEHGAYIIKSHRMTESSRNRLLIEADIFRALNPEIYIDLKEIGEVIFFVMQELAPLEGTGPSLEEIRSLCLVLEFQEELAKQLMGKVPSAAVYLEYGELSAKKLLETQEIDDKIYDKIGAALELLEKWLSTAPKVLCHGDLSDVNIMRNRKGDLVLIDFEDAFIGYPDYDFLYWLTFFRHRCYYRPGLLDDISLSIPREVARATILMIVVMKCWISVLSGAVSFNSLSNRQRIEEIIML